MMARYAKIAALLGALLLPALVLGQSRYFPVVHDSDRQAGIEGKSILVLPMNLWRYREDILAEREDNAFEPLLEYLRTAGYDVHTYPNMRHYFRNVLEAMDGPYDPHTGELRGETLMRGLFHILDQLPDLPEYDYIYLPEFKSHDALVEDEHMSWDGVVQRFRTEEFTGRVRYEGYSTRKGLSFGGMMLTREGDAVLLNYGGIEPLSVLNHRTRTQRIRDDLLEEESLIRHGISIALHPFIEYDEY